MVYLHRLYTRAGDAGETSLGDGRRVAKTSLPITAMAALDETNAAIGLAAASLCDPSLRETLKRLQNDLFEIGAEFALAEEPPRITPSHVVFLENEIDRATAARPPLTSFILPGGTPVAAALHMARTISRRAEIETLRLAEQSPVNEQTRIYLNRLSDLLFALARLSTRPEEEILWQPNLDRE